MAWLDRWNFIARARLERELWDAFEKGEDPEALVASLAQRVEGGEDSEGFRLEVWQTTLTRIRKIEALMRDQRPPAGPPPGSSPTPPPPAADPD
jgi:hypothetical protein